ncbi:hypothetical protein [Chondromyces crocatus]|uniref:Uncharacterized protein n=1 Tax=Chondromyces crocatus TaxID=52 RepID=A0A0K1ECA0_CHOCO|nr:hypothetical protein [Chondromyces crocatus]AKT38188.1 uncharacterized protein CMC5_023310 [Chondromyces crocatus]
MRMSRDPGAPDNTLRSQPRRLSRRFPAIMVAMAMGTGLCMTGWSSTAAAETVEAAELHPLQAHLESKITDSGARTMLTDVTLQRSGEHAGQLYARTVTSNRVRLTGFTGGVFVVLKNDQGAVVGISGLHTFGVDGRSIGTYRRDEVWIEQIDPRVAAATTQIEIVHQRATRDRLPSILKRIAEFKQAGCQIIHVQGVCD